jgi:hypothetical protein
MVDVAVTVCGMIVVHVLAALVSMNSEAGRPNQRDDGSGLQPRGIVDNVDAPADEIEVQLEHAWHGEDVANERCLVGAIHAADVKPQFGAGRR